MTARTRDTPQQRRNRLTTDSSFSTNVSNVFFAPAAYMRADPHVAAGCEFAARSLRVSLPFARCWRECSQCIQRFESEIIYQPIEQNE
jgi:hypothetical protein